MKLEQEVRSLIRETWPAAADMTLDFDLGTTGTTGDDAGEFMEEFLRRFHVKPTGFVLNNYFDPPLMTIRGLFHHWFGRKRLQPLTIRTLVAAAVKHTWRT
jgi:hypothetical protein